MHDKNLFFSGLGGDIYPFARVLKVQAFIQCIYQANGAYRGI
jgi:hypothetical protein